MPRMPRGELHYSFFVLVSGPDAPLYIPEEILQAFLANKQRDDTPPIELESSIIFSRPVTFGY